MPFPPDYNKTVSFTEYAGNNPASPYNAPDHDTEFTNIETTLDAIVALLKMVTRSDGRLANNSVTPEALSTTALQMASIGWKPRGMWKTATAYAVGDLVEGAASISFVCSMDHTSAASIDIDRGAGRWVCIGNGISAAVNDIVNYATAASASKDAAVIAKSQAESAAASASGSATAASGSATAASNSATAAGGSATSAAGSATSAAGSAAAAAASAASIAPLNGANVIGSGDLLFSGTGQRIKGDFSGVVTNRLMFQSSTVNGSTRIAAIPHGTSQVSAFSALNSADPANASSLALEASGTLTKLSSSYAGSGSFLPLVIETGGSESFRFNADKSGAYLSGNHAGNKQLGVVNNDAGATSLASLGLTSNSGYLSSIKVSTAAGGYAKISSSGGPMYLGTDDANITSLRTNNVDRLIFGPSGEYGIAGTNYGTVGQVLTSSGPGSSPSWVTPVVVGKHMVIVNTANGYGSTNTMIRRFSTVVSNIGSSITYTDSATLGASFTVNVAGFYSITYTEQFSVSATFGISISTTAPTTIVYLIPASEQLGTAQTPAANASSTVTWTGYLAAGAVIRPHTTGGVTGTLVNTNKFTIARLS